MNAKKKGRSRAFNAAAVERLINRSENRVVTLTRKLRRVFHINANTICGKINELKFRKKQR